MLATGARVSLAAPGLEGPPGGDGLTAVLTASTWIPAGAEWRFFRGLAEPAGGSLRWTEPGFDDAAWGTGPAGFGYGDGDDATLLADMQGRYSTVYLRRTFHLEAPIAAATIALGIDYDDGFIAFLNGREIARANAGPPGSYPAFDALATADHDAGSAESFRVEDAAAFLVPGTNVLAVVGFNFSRGSSDFSLHPEMRSGDLLAGCPDEYYVAGGGLVLAGKAPVPAASEVRVNGELAAFSPATGDWSYAPPLPGAGATTLAIEARDPAGAAVAGRTLTVTRARVLGGELAADATLGAAGGPFIVAAQVLLPAGGRLSIGPGCEFLIASGVGFDIAGEVKALGTSTAPIRFTRLPCGENWGFFRLTEATGESTFRFCEWAWSTGSPGCLTARDSRLELDGCWLHDLDGEGVHSTGGKSHIRNCLSERTREAFSLDEGDALVEFSIVRDAIGKSDLIDSNGATDPPARIAFNLIYGTTDDGIDADRGSVIIEGNIIHDCGDQAMSLVGAGSSTVLRNLCYRNGNGLSVKDAHVAFADANTFVLNTVTGARAIEKTPGRGGGFITLKNSIVWGNVAQLVVDSGGVIDVSYSDVEGGLFPGPGNLSLDPRFVAAAADDFRLGEGSPCIGAGEGGADLGALPFTVTLAAPTGLTAAVSAPSSVTLAWNDASANEDGFEVERAVGGDDFAALVKLPANAGQFTDAGLDPGVTYGYRVRAFQGAAFSAYAGPVEARIAPEPPELSGIEPAEGPAAGGTPVVIRGRNFHGQVTGSLGGAPLLAVEVMSPEEIRAVTPAGARGPADLVVVTAAGEASRDAAFAYFDAYLRGDVLGDGRRDISDAISVLNYLFRGGTPPPCLDAADSSRDGSLNITDPVYLLAFLFSGGPAPAPDGARCHGDG